MRALWIPAVLSCALSTAASPADESTRPPVPPGRSEETPPAKPSGETAKPEDDAHARNARLGRGINLGNALEAPEEGAWGVRLEAGYFAAIREAGFDTVRLPVRWSAHADVEPPYAIDPDFASRVDWAIDRALEQGLQIIVNVHHYAEMDASPDEHRPRLLALWRQIAGRLRDRPQDVHLELFNEPHDRFTEEKWNEVLPELLAVVRESNPTRAVIVGPGRWNSIASLDRLELPPDDRHLIVTVHYYEPFQFTHQSASWVEGSERWKGRRWTGSDEERAAVTRQLEKAAAWAKERDRPLFLGEFGAFGAADIDSRARWTRHVASEARRLGISSAYWEFCSGFGAFDSKTGTWRAPLRDALLAPPDAGLDPTSGAESPSPPTTPDARPGNEDTPQ